MVSHLPDTYAIFISAGLDSSMHSMDEKRNTPEMPGAERMKTPIHPGNGILRRAIRGNIVSFPSQIPSFPKGSQADMQWRMVLLFFVRGWSVAKIATRFQVPNHRVWTLLNGWSVRAMAQGKPSVKDGRRALPDAAVKMRAEAPAGWDGTLAGGGTVDSTGESADLIAALDVAVAHCEEWRGEFWAHMAAHRRALRTAALAALEAGRSSDRRDGFFTTSQTGKGSLSRGLRGRDAERASHAVA